MSSSTDQREGIKACSYGDYLDILRELPVLSGVPLDVIKVLAYLSAQESFPPGEALCEQGDPMDRSFYLLCGEVDVERRSGEQITAIARRREGFFFGGLGLLAPAKSLYTVRTATEVTCLVLTKEKFHKTVERFPDILPKILRNVVEHVFRWEEAFLKNHPEECASRGEELGLSLF